MDHGTLLILLPLSFFVATIVFSFYTFFFLTFFSPFFFLGLFIVLQVLMISSQSISFQSGIGYYGWNVIVFYHVVDGDGVYYLRIILCISK